jgi:hypothetical protein
MSRRNLADLDEGVIWLLVLGFVALLTLAACLL